MLLRVGLCRVLLLCSSVIECWWWRFGAGVAALLCLCWRSCNVAVAWCGCRDVVVCVVVVAGVAAVVLCCYRVFHVLLCVVVRCCRCPLLLCGGVVWCCCVVRCLCFKFFF